ncbi:MAG TPA: type II CAAX endopeptidase family protein [Candidatus Acidoferrales bacterium]|nr:type II CAAX endopeptidase family protein [Candidatus Acidoferrales bacterium]
MHWDYILLLAILAVLVPWRSLSRIRELVAAPQLASSQRMMLYASTIIFQGAAVAVILWRCSAHHLSLAAIGVAFPPPLGSIIGAVGLSLILVLNQIYAIRHVATLPHEGRGVVAKLAEKLLPRTKNEAVLGTLLVLTVAICEEFIYRGFVQTVFTTFLAGSAAAAAVISAAFFSSAHAYQGRKGLITTFAVGVILSAVRIWTGSLFPSIIIHFAVDFSVGVAALRFLPFRGDPLALISLHLSSFSQQIEAEGSKEAM